MVEDRSTTGATPFASHLRQTQFADQVNMGGRAEVHRPVGWRWQMDGATQITRPMRPDEHGFTLESSAEATWLVADRWQGSWRVAQRRRLFEPRHTDLSTIDGWRTEWQSSLGFYVEDHTRLSVSLEQSQSRDLGYNSRRRPWRRDTQLNFGITYRFLGALDGPGGIEPQRRFDPPSLY